MKALLKFVLTLFLIVLIIPLVWLIIVLVELLFGSMAVAAMGEVFWVIVFIIAIVMIIKMLG